MSTIMLIYCIIAAVCVVIQIDDVVVKAEGFLELKLINDDHAACLFAIYLALLRT